MNVPRHEGNYNYTVVPGTFQAVKQLCTQAHNVCVKFCVVGSVAVCSRLTAELLPQSNLHK